MTDRSIRRPRGIHRFRRHRLALAFGLIALAAPPPARAATVEIDCDSPDDFCAALDDPCNPQDNLVITVASCTPNFGARTFQNEGKIRVPNGGTLTITAGSIIVDAKIDGKHAKVSPDDNGANVSLIATNDVTVNKKINVSGRETAGSILIDAGGNVAVNSQVIARGQGGSSPTATGGTITIDADGTVSSEKRGKLIVRGKKKVTAAGAVSVNGDLGVTLKGRIEARGLFGGSVAATTGGNMSIEEEIRAYGEFSSGGTVNLNAGGSITIGGKKGTVRAAGGAPGGGGDVTIAAGGVVDVTTIRARGNSSGGDGGTVAISGSDVSARVIQVLSVQGNGGDVDVTSTSGTVDLTSRIDADSKTGNGGIIDVNAATDAAIDGPIFASGSGVGGEIRIAAGGAIDLGQNKNSKFEADGAAGGVIEADSTGAMNVAGRFSAAVGGCIAFVEPPVPTIMAGSTFDPPSQATSCP